MTSCRRFREAYFLHLRYIISDYFVDLEIDLSQEPCPESLLLSFVAYIGKNMHSSAGIATR